MFAEEKDELTKPHDCNEEDCDCEHDHCDDNIITLDMEDGSQRDFLVLDVIEYKAVSYVALAEVDSNEYDILRMDVQDDIVELAVIEDDELFNQVAAKFDEHFLGETQE